MRSPPFCAPALAAGLLRAGIACAGPSAGAAPLDERVAAAVAAGAGEFVVPPGTHILPRGLTFRGVTNFTLRGDAGAVLALPPAALAVSGDAVPAGAGEIPVSRVCAMTPGMTLEIAAPGPVEPFTGRPRPAFTARLQRPEADRLVMAGPLPFAVPAGTWIRDANAPNLIAVFGGDRLTIEDLVLDGGRLAGDPPLQGHARLCGIFAEGPYAYDRGPTGPPVRRLTVRRCTIRNFFGRGFAGYAIEDAVVDSCTVADCADEGIDLDHFALRCRAVANRVARCRIGIELNDASGCAVEDNEFTDCGTGINLWRWCRQPGLNTGNVIESNRFAAIRGDAIRLATGTSGNVVRANWIDGAGGLGISIAGRDQTVLSNRISAPPARRIVVHEGAHRIADPGAAQGGREPGEKEP